MSMKKAISPIAVCLALAAALTTAGTLAYLTDRDSVANVFTVGSVSVVLDEADTGLDGDGDPATNDYPMRRAEDGDGWGPIAKDPTITVKAGSSDCWLFVQLEESEGFGGYLAYEVAEGWTALLGEGVPAGVYYREVLEGDADQRFQVLVNDELTVAASEDWVRELERSVRDGASAWPTLQVTAYAVQRAGIADPAAAWGMVGGATG